MADRRPETWYRGWRTEVGSGVVVVGVVVLLLVGLVGCIPAGAGPALEGVVMTETVPPLPPATSETPLPPPAIIASTETPLPAFAPLSVSEVAAKQATVDAAISEEISSAVTATPPAIIVVPTDLPSPSPLPTFTPPALPNTPPWEHYWFRRPVSIDSVLWTNKHYSYGSSRGGQLRTHHGVEFDVPYGTEIMAVASGTVRVAGNDLDTAYGPHTNFYGNLVVIEHDSQLNGRPVFTLYGHLSQPIVAVGQQVAVEQVIGLSGASGVADGAHMHFEVRVGTNSYDRTYNPLLWLYPFPDRGTVAGRVTWADGSLAYDAPVTLTRIDGEAPYYSASTYADESVNGDEGWNENFAIDDVYAGYYEVEVNVAGQKFKQEFWVYPFQTSFVEIVLG